MLLVLISGIVGEDPLGIGLPQGPSHVPPESLPNATLSGYLDVDTESGSAMFFVFYEAQTGSITEDTPMLVWLQVGCLVSRTAHSSHGLPVDGLVH